MNMINVLQRLAELDSKNPNVAKPALKVTPDAAVQSIQKTLSEELSVDSLRYLSGVKSTLEECGMMPGMMPQESMMPPPTPSTPASFSINATAASGTEVADMLTQIMTLAGAHKAGPVGPEHMPADLPHTSISTVPPMSGADSMKKMLDVMNDKPEDEGMMGSAAGAGLGALVGGPMGAMAGGAIGSELTKEADPETDAGEVDVSGVGGALAGAAVDGDLDGAIDGYEAGKEISDGLTDDYDNSGADSNAIAGPGSVDFKKWNYEPNAGGGGDRMDGNMPKGRVTSEDSMTEKLYRDYQKFVTEAKK